MTGKNYRDTTLQIIRDFERLRLSSYPDGSGYSIGYGCQYYEDWTRVKANQTITKERAEKLLEFHTKSNAGYVNEYIKVPLNQNQFDALVSLCYNIGAGNFSNKWRQVMDAVNKDPNDADAVYKAFTSINFNPNRRKTEGLIYAQSTYARSPQNYLFWFLLVLLILYLRKKSK